MRWLFSLAIAANALLAVNASPLPGNTAAGFSLTDFKNLITFGDSYTDERRALYLLQNSMMSPPPGTLLEPYSPTASGGIVWARWLAIYTGATLYDYAVQHAVCSNHLTPTSGPIENVEVNIPDVLGYQIPAYLDDVAFINSTTYTNTLFTDRTAENSVYAMWIGMSDITSSFLSDSQITGKTIPQFTDCVFDAFDSIYKSGGRFFVLMNMAPLELAPRYSATANAGMNTVSSSSDPANTAPTFFEDLPHNGQDYNATALHYKVQEYTSLVNRIWELQLPYVQTVSKRYPGAKFALYDVHSLFTEMYNNPSPYFNGSLAPNVTGMRTRCENCSSSANDSFMWYDELHPSERVDQVLASGFIDVLNGSSQYATYWQG